MKRKNIIILAISIIIILSIIGFTYGRFTYESETIGSVTTTSRNPFEIGTLAYNIVNNAMHTKDKESTIYSEEPLTTPAKEINREDERTLSVTEDDYGISYYYRGNVKDNYIDFNGMCWRIVRIEGDGSIKLILEDKTNTCKDATGGDNASIGIASYGYTGNGTSDSPYRADYENGDTKKKLDEWIDTFDKNLLKEEEWCLGEFVDNTNLTDVAIKISSNNIDLKCSKTIKSYSGLLSALEYSFAGAKVNTNNSNLYLNNASINYNLLNVHIRYNEENKYYDQVFHANNTGGLHSNKIQDQRRTRPSIVLTEGIKLLSGDGTKENAYKINENPFESGTLAYNIVNNAINPKEETSTIYSPSPKTIPAQEVSKENERTLSVTKDDYGRSYYYRGNVKDNYIDFNGMCWRIVRIEGDGSIKLILEDKTSTCKNATGGDNASIEKGTFGYKGEKTEGNPIKADYEKCEKDSDTCIKNKIDAWLNENNFDKKLLKEDIWNIGDTETIYKYNGTGISQNVESCGGDVVTNQVCLYDSRNRLRNGIATLISPEKNLSFKSYVALLTADEVAFAGGKLYTQNKNYYLCSVSSSAILSLSAYYGTNDNESFKFSDVTYIISPIESSESPCQIGTTMVKNSNNIKPSIVLNKDIKLICGDGTKGNAYKIDENPFDEGTLAYNIVDNAINPKSETSTIYSPVPKTIPAQEVSGENERTLSVTEDTLGRSYYFRGNVNDNYLTFNNMCWRIVRIEGDGSIKLILYDKDNTCENANGNAGNILSNSTFGYKIEDDYYKIDYENCTSDNNTCAKNSLSDFFDTKLKDKQNLLKQENWFSIPESWYDKDGNKLEYEYNKTLKYSDVQARLRSDVKVDTYATLKTNNKINENLSYIGLLTADEVAFAGGVSTTLENHNNPNYYLSAPYYWWTSSISLIDNGSSDCAIDITGNNSNISSIGSLSVGGSDTRHPRPSIVLNKGIKITSGNGTKDNAYTIE